MRFVTRIIYKKSFWGLFFIGLNLALGQMPFDFPFWSFSSLILLGLIWEIYKPSEYEALIWGLGLGFGYFGLTFFWIVEPFLIKPNETGWMAPFAVIGLVALLSGILAINFFFSAKIGKGQRSITRLLTLSTFWVLSEFLRSEYLLNFPWGLISSIWINTPMAQGLSLFGPYWLSALTIFSAFLISRPWIGSLTGTLVIFSLYSFGYERLKLEVYERIEPLKVRIVQPNIEQSKKWNTEFAKLFLNKHIELSKNTVANSIDLIIWPETAISYGVQNNKKIRDLISKNVGVPLVLGARRYDSKERRLYNTAFLLSDEGDVLDFYDKVKLVPFGEYIPFGEVLANFSMFGIATDGLVGFSKGKSKNLVSTEKFGTFLMLICYEAIFPNLSDNLENRASWLIHITNDAWFGKLSGPYQHLTLARMRAIEQGLPMVRSANTGISAIIDPYGIVISKLGMGREGYLDGSLPAALDPTLYSRLGTNFFNLLLVCTLMLTISILIIITFKRNSKKLVLGM